MDTNMTLFELRWAQLDVARQMESVDFIKNFISLLEDSGYNGLLLYLEDRIKTPSYQLPADNEVYTADEIRDIIKFAADHGIEVIPCVATLGHAERFLRHCELSHLAELQGEMKGRFGGVQKLTFCVTHPDFYRFIGSYLKEVAELFPSQWFHIGLDEFWDFNLCSRCRKAMPTRTDEWKMFVSHIRKIRNIMAECGKRVMMWSDMFEFYPEALEEIPRDVVMVDWQYQHDVRNYLGHLLDCDSENRLAVNAAKGFETIVAPADRTLWNSQSYLKYAAGKKGVRGGLLTCWEKSDTFLYRTLPIFVAAGLQMNGMSPDKAFDAMTIKLFGTEDAVFRAALKMALNGGLLRHFDGVKENALCTRDYFGLKISAMNVCSGALTILKNNRDKVSSRLGRICLDDLIDALHEKELSLQGKMIVQDIFDNTFTAELKGKFAEFRNGFEKYLDHMAARWQVYRKNILPNVFAERKSGVLVALDQLAEKLASNAWIKITGTLPDYFGVENIGVEYKVDGKWVNAASGVYKPDEDSIFCRFIPLEKDFTQKVEAVRLTAHGLGGIGINHVEISAGGRHYVPKKVLNVTGRVSDPEYLLNDNTTFAWFGGQSTRHDYFDHDAAEEKHSVTLEMRDFSPDELVMIPSAHI